MSVKVPAETIQYQSHNHCQCDFCSSRRSVNAKKLSASQRVAQLQHAKQRNGCCCSCHDAVNASTFAASHNANGTFDPAYPSPVNQTALNASRGRVGAPNGQSTATNRQQSAANGGQLSKEESEKAALDDLDRLERLLILEHKARIAATLEADRVGTLRDSRIALSTASGPQPLPAGYNFGGSGSSNYRSGDAMFDGADVATVQEAYELAKQCPVPPAVQCRSSHRLQDTMDDIRAVTMDPVNPAGRTALQRVLYANGLASTPVTSDSAKQHTGTGADGDAVVMEFGNSLAKNRTGHSHPQGAGVVWVNGQKVDASASMAKADGSAIPATQYQQADGSGVAKPTKTVTYAL